MTKHNFVKLVWNVNNYLAQKTDKSRLLSALYFPIDRRLFWWCFDNAPYNILFSSFGGASKVAGCEDSFTRAALEDYAPGLWTGIRGDYKEYTDIQILLYLGEDGTGHTVIYGPEVLNMEDVFAAEFTWDVRGNNVVLVGPNSGSMELSLVNGELVFAGLYPLHKYTVEDNLYGPWQSVEPVVEDGVSYDIVQMIKSDGTGVEIWTVPGSDAASAKYTFTWKMIDAITYEAVYDDGEVWQFKSVDTQLYDGETTYNKVGFDILQDYALNKGIV